MRLINITNGRALAHIPRRGPRATGVAIITLAIFTSLTSAATGSSTRSTARSSTTTTFYASPSDKQYVNNGGDRARGVGNNPFGNYAGAALNIPVNASERLSGPFPGDIGEYQFTLFATSARNRSAGKAIFICQYGFDQNAICDIALELSGGIIVGKGPMNFNDSHFSFSATGGTGRYRATKGTILVTASGPSTQAQPVKRSVPLLQALTLDVTANPIAGTGATDWHPVAIKEVPSNETFIDNNDDEARGDVNNPWGGINNGAAAIIDEHVNGPFPGDEAFFTLRSRRGRVDQGWAS